jgi:hypothetical protein
MQVRRHSRPPGTTEKTLRSIRPLLLPKKGRYRRGHTAIDALILAEGYATSSSNGDSDADTEQAEFSTNDDGQGASHSSSKKSKTRLEKIPIASLGVDQGVRDATYQMRSIMTKGIDKALPCSITSLI